MQEGQQPDPGTPVTRARIVRPAGVIPGDRRSRPAGVIPGDRRSRSGRGPRLSAATTGRIIAEKGWVPFPALPAAGDDARGVRRIPMRGAAAEVRAV